MNNSCTMGRQMIMVRPSLLRVSFLAMMMIWSGVDSMIFPNPLRYVKTQEKCVRFFGGMNKGSRILEVDAQEGAKYLYYLPFGSAVKQLLNPQEFAKDKGPVRVAAQKLGLTIDFVQLDESLEVGAFDAAISVGAVKRAGDQSDALVDTTLRSLRPEGRFYLVEPDASHVEPLLAAALDDNELVASCQASVEDDIIVCLVTRAQSDIDSSRSSPASAVAGFGTGGIGGKKKKKTKKGR